jgi:hypothetical protein
MRSSDRDEIFFAQGIRIIYAQQRRAGFWTFREGGAVSHIKAVARSV